MKTKKSFSYPWIIMIAILSSPLAFLAPAEALPVGVPNLSCGSLSSPSPGTLCYTVTPGGGKVNAGGGPKNFAETIIQATESEYVIADVKIEITSSAGDINLPTVSQISPGGQASVVSVATDKLRELRQIKGELQSKATVLAGPALIEAQTKLSALQEQERNYENVVTTVTAAGQDAGKFKVSGASARSRSCGFANLDMCGSWVEYNVYTVKRYVGDPIAAYNRAFAVAQDAQNTIDKLVAASKPTSRPSESKPPEGVEPTISTSISCVNSDGTFVTVAEQAGNKGVLFTWKTTEFGPEFTPENRCRIVSNKFNDFVRVNGGTFSNLYLTTGVVNGYPVICMNRSGEKSCNVLFTLKQKNRRQAENIIRVLKDPNSLPSNGVDESGSDNPPAPILELSEWSKRKLSSPGVSVPVKKPTLRNGGFR
jgi:Circadian oscillating protein COP23